MTALYQVVRKAMTPSIARLERALHCAIREHGPDAGSFGCSELQWLYGGPTATIAGRIGRRQYQEPVRVVDALVTYNVESRRFDVTPKPEEENAAAGPGDPGPCPDPACDREAGAGCACARPVVSDRPLEPAGGAGR